jgi:hypothetical protein
MITKMRHEPRSRKPSSFILKVGRLHKEAALISQVCDETVALRSYRTATCSSRPVTCFRAFPLYEIDPEIAALLELLIANEEFDETAEQFKQSSRSWHQYSEEEKNRLLAKAASMMSKGRR